MKEVWITWGAASSSSWKKKTWRAWTKIKTFALLCYNQHWMTDERQNKRSSAKTSNCGTSAGAAAAGAGAAAPAIMTGASEMFSFDFSKLFRSATWWGCNVSGSVSFHKKRCSPPTNLSPRCLPLSAWSSLSTPACKYKCFEWNHSPQCELWPSLCWGGALLHFWEMWQLKSCGKTQEWSAGVLKMRFAKSGCCEFSGYIFSALFRWKWPAFKIVWQIST